VLRVATYNVRSLRDDRDALIRVIRAMRPDVLCLQEAPRFAAWRRKRRLLARDAGMTVAAGDRAGGVAVLTGPGARILHARGHMLRWIPGLEQRAMAVAVVDKDGERLTVASAHLDLVPRARLRHAVQIMRILDGTARSSGAPAVLAADVNETPGQPVWSLLNSHYPDCLARSPGRNGGAVSAEASPVLSEASPIPGQAGPVPAEAGFVPAGGGMPSVGDATFPAWRPAARIDAIFADAALRVLAYGVPPAAAEDLRRATDHVPVFADITHT
jgi:endonuclease/exonuclease/phosphatase family metal-dependent hydrolase